jgi:hypothetical protein
MTIHGGSTGGGIKAKGALQAFFQAFPKIACLAPSFSKLIFGGFEEFQGVTSLTNDICWFPNFSLRSPLFGLISNAARPQSAPTAPQGD